MSKKEFDVAAMLNKPHFEQAVHSDMLAPDPAVPTRVRVNIDQLVPYAENPRTTQNPNYDEIKESIRNRGLDHAPNITRKNPADPYMIKDGGNTRLAILKELWEETRDTRFYNLDCMFHPWTNDLDILVGHMVENEARGSMLFIERAVAANSIKQKIEAEENTTLSVRELSRRITELGWPLAAQTISQLLYANEILFPVIPETFWNGIGNDAVKKIRKVIDNARKFWESVAKPEEGNFEEIWKQVFSAMDGDAFDITEAQNQLESEIAIRLNSPIMAVRGEIQAITQGISPGGVRPTNIIPENPVEHSPKPIAPPKGKQISPTKTPPAQEVSHSGEFESSEAPEIADVFVPQVPMQQPAAPIYAVAYGNLIDQPVEALMENAYILAVEFASYYGYESCVQLPSDYGLTGYQGFHSGYFLSLPDERTQHHLLNHWEALCSYIYLQCLASWIENDNTAEMQAFSSRYVLSWVPQKDLEGANTAIPFFQCVLASPAHQNNDEDNSVYAYKAMLELQATVGLIFRRFQSHQAQQGA